MQSLAIPSSLGDVADRITILTIKSERMRDAAKLANVGKERTEISDAFFAAVARTPEFDMLFERLKAINEQLWEIEDAIRQCEAKGDFGPEFIRLARSVYRTNDTRAEIKREINILLGSNLVEEKSYFSL